MEHVYRRQDKEKDKEDKDKADQKSTPSVQNTLGHPMRLRFQSFVKVGNRQRLRN